MAETTSEPDAAREAEQAPDVSASGGRKPEGISWGVWATAAVIVLAFVVAVWFSFRFIQSERERALLEWQTRLGILAESRSSAIGDWVARQKSEIRSLADRDSVRLYVEELRTAADEGRDLGASPEAQFLRNLLEVTADRMAFTGPPAGPDVPANVGRRGTAGLGIVAPDGRLLAATRDMPAVEAPLRRFLETVTGNEARLFDLHAGPTGTPTLGVVAPVRRAQADGVPIAHVVGLKPVAVELYPLLRQAGAPERSGEALLVRRDDGVVTYLSPLRDGKQPLEHRMDADTASLAEAAAIANPGGFFQARDYRGVEVLATSRAVPGTPWVLVYKVDRNEALGATEARLTRLLVILVLFLAFVAAAFAGIWRHGASRRASVAAARFEALARRFEKQSDMMTLLTDSQPNAIYFVDTDSRVRFANEVAARRAGMTTGEVPGKTLAAVVGTERAKRVGRLDREALEDNRTVRDLNRFEDEAGLHVLQTRHIPIEATEDTPRGVLIVEEDITAAVTERERREANLGQMVQTLIDVLDRRDPNAANHSGRTAEIARAIAGEMDLDSVTVETAGYVGQMLNLGKILVPPDLLVKPDRLTDDELRRVHEALDAGPDLLQGIDFDGPVAESLRQVREKWDGSGPQGLKGGEILMPARIAAVANAFVAMVSPRAHRGGMEIDAALDALLRAAGSEYDRGVVAALVNHVENRGGKADLLDSLGEIPAA